MLKKLTETMGISGQENAVRKLILQEIKPYCTSVRTDSMGNLIAYKKGKSGKSAYPLFDISERKGGDGVLLSAHMDEVGFLITDITEDGYLKFDTVGGIDPSVLVSKRVIVNGLHGVISFKAVHLTTKEEREKPVTLKDLCIDIGATSKAEAEKYVTVGDYCGFESEYIEYGKHKVKAKALDDRAGCCILMELLKQEWECDLTCLFNVQEEVGLRGAKTAIYGLKPDYAVVVEATTCNDMTGIEEGQRVTEQSKGAAISVLDSASFANAEIVSLLVTAAQRANVKYQKKASTRGGNDAGAIHLANGGIRTASISIPCRYIHSPVSVMDKRDYDSCLAILTQFMSDMRAKPTEAIGEAITATYLSGFDMGVNAVGTLKNLCNLFNVSGIEGSAGYIYSELESAADEVRTDEMYNVIAHFKGEGEPLVIECGIDNDGLMVTACSDLKKVRVAAVGSPKIADWVGKRVRFATGASGIVNTEEEKAEKADDIYIEVDCGETHICDFAVMPAEFTSGSGAPETETAFSNNLSACVPALCLIETAKRWKEQGSKRDTYFLFSAQKRLGARGARAVLGGLKPQYLLTVNTRESEESKVGILVKEKNAVAHEQMRQALEQAAQAAEIPYALTVGKESRFAETLSLAGNGSIFGGLYIPIEKKEGLQERILLKTVENARKILLQVRV